MVIDPGVGSARDAILVRANEQWYLAPDNGVLTLILERYPDHDVYALFRETSWWRAHNTFDGLALFAPAAACVANREPIESISTRLDSPIM